MSIELSSKHSVAEIVAYIRHEIENPDPEREAAKVRELKQCIADYEREFGFPSSEIHEGIENKTLREDERVCDWLMTIAVLHEDEE